MSHTLLAGLASLTAGLSVSCLALWVLAAAQARTDSLERRILGGPGSASTMRLRRLQRTGQRGLPVWAHLAWPAWLGGVLCGGPALGAVLAVGAAVGCLTWSNAGIRRKRRVLTYAVQGLIRDLHLMASSGDTAARCLRLAADRSEPSLRDILRPALLGIQAGQGLCEAISEIPALSSIPEFSGLVQALWLHVETGASLSLLLAESAERVDEAAMLRGEADSKLAEAKSTARILATVPVAVGLYLWSFNRGAILPLVSDPAGKAALALGSMMWFAGVWAVSRMQVPPPELGGEY